MKDWDIKKVWNEQAGEPSQAFDPAAIQQLLTRKDRNIVARFIFALRFEMWFNLVVLSLLVGVLIWEAHGWVATFLLVVDVGYLFYYRKLINEMSRKKIDRNVLEYLQSVHDLIGRFMRHYQIASLTLSIPLFLTGMYFANPSLFSEVYFSKPWFIALLLIVFAVALLAFYLFLYFFYGKKANRIKELIDELQQQEAAHD